MTGHDAPRAERIAEDVWIKLTSRLAMLATPLVIAFIGWMASGWLDDQEKAILTVATRVSGIEETADDLTERVVILETNQTRGRADRERFEAQIVAELRDMRATLGLLSNRVAALDATIQAMRDRADAGQTAPTAVVR